MAFGKMSPLMQEHEGNGSNGGGSGSLSTRVAQRSADTVGSPEQNNVTNNFGLTPEEVDSIGRDMTDNLPILGSNPAIIKLLAALGFTDATSNEKDGILILGVNEYEVFKTQATRGQYKGKEVAVIRMPNHYPKGEYIDMVKKLIKALQSLFPERILNFSLEALQASADKHGIYPGGRFWDDGRSVDVDYAVYGWRDDASWAESAPYECCYCDGQSVSFNGDRRSAVCLVASFG